MSWKEMSAMDLRLEFVSLALAEGANIKALCEHFNIGRTTAYKWLKRFQCEGRRRRSTRLDRLGNPAGDQGPANQQAAQDDQWP